MDADCDVRWESYMREGSGPQPDNQPCFPPPLNSSTKLSREFHLDFQPVHFKQILQPEVFLRFQFIYFAFSASFWFFGLDLLCIISFVLSKPSFAFCLLKFFLPFREFSADLSKLSQTALLNPPLLSQCQHVNHHHHHTPTDQFIMDGVCEVTNCAIALAW